MGLSAGEHIWMLPIADGIIDMRDRFHIGVGYPFTDGMPRNRIDSKQVLYRYTAHDKCLKGSLLNKTFSE